MTDFFADLVSITTILFAVGSMLSVGLRFTIQEIVEPLRSARLLIGALVANFVLVPVLAYAITEFMSFGEDREIGLLVVAAAAGAPFLIKLTQLAGEDVAVATGLLVLLLLTTIVYMPLVVPRIAPEADVSVLSIAQPLVLTMLLPLIIGLIVDYLTGNWTDRLLPYFGTVTSITLVVLVISTVIANFGRIVEVLGEGAILAALLFIAGAFVIGYVCGMTGLGTRQEMALATGQRNIAAAMVVATQSIGEPDTVVMVIVASIAGMAVLFPTARLLRQSAERREANMPARGQATG